MKLLVIVFIIFSAGLCVQSLTNTKGVMDWIIPSRGDEEPKEVELRKKENYTSKRMHIFSKLAFVAHELSYDKEEKVKENDVGFNFRDLLLGNGDYIEKSNLKVIWGQLKQFPDYGIVSFRGSDNLSNFMTDVNYPQIDLTTKDKIGKGCKVHRGFLNGYKILRDELRAKFTTFMEKAVNPKDANGLKYIIITGHSLGGALASLLAYDLGVYLKSDKHKFNPVPNLFLVTFGSPRVGDECFSKMMNGLGLAANVRVVFNDDPIAGVPNFKEFTHIGTEYNFSTIEEYKSKTLNVDETARANNPFKVLWDLKNIQSHLQYKHINRYRILQAVKENMNALKIIKWEDVTKQRKLK